MEDLSNKDFTSNQEVRWCPGCGDYAILRAMQKALPNLQIRKEDFVFISGNFVFKFHFTISVEAKIRLLIDLKNLDENLIAIVIDINKSNETIII